MCFQFRAFAHSSFGAPAPPNPSLLSLSPLAPPPHTHTSPSHSTGHQIVPAAQCSPLPENPPPTGAKERHRQGEEEVKVTGKGTATAEIPALSFVLTEQQAADAPPSLRPWCRHFPLSAHGWSFSLSRPAGGWLRSPAGQDRPETLSVSRACGRGTGQLSGCYPGRPGDALPSPPACLLSYPSL